jgi:hypothetical protein
MKTTRFLVSLLFWTLCTTGFAQINSPGTLSFPTGTAMFNGTAYFCFETPTITGTEPTRADQSTPDPRWEISATGTGSWTVFQISDLTTQIPLGSIRYVRRGVQYTTGGTYNYTNVVALSRPSTPVLQFVSQSNPSCGASNGSLQVRDASNNETAIRRTFFLYKDGAFVDSSGTGSFSNLGRGFYEVNVKLPCYASPIGGTVQRNLSEPTTFSVTSIIASNHTDCVRDNLALEVQMNSGANLSDLEYSMNDGPWQNSRVFSFRSSSTFNLRVRSKTTGCIVYYTQNISEFETPYGGTFTFLNLGDCNLGNARMIWENPQGSTGECEYRLNNGSWFLVPDFSNLSTGTYTLSVRRRSGNDCIVDYPFNISETLGPAITQVLVSGDLDCPSGNAALTVQTNGNIGVGNIQYRVNTGAWQNSNVFNGLSSGNYNLEIRTTSGCAPAVASASKTITEIPVAQISQINAVANDQDCVTGNLQIAAVLTTPVAGVEYRLNGTGAWQSSPIFSNLITGTHVIEVRSPYEGGFCTTSLSRVVQEFQAVSLTTLTKINEIDCTTGNAIIEASHNGGTLGGIEFRLNSGTWQSSNRFTGLGNGTYTVAIRTSGIGGCVLPGNSLQTTIAERSGNVVISGVGKTGETDCTSSNTSLTVTLATAVSPVFYRIPGKRAWQTSNVFTGLNSGSYVVEASPTNTGTACISQFPITVDEKVGAITGYTVANDKDCTQGNVVFTLQHNGTPSSEMQFRVAGSATWQSSPVFTNLTNFYSYFESRTVGGCTSRTVNINLVEGPSDAEPRVESLTHLSGETDCIVGNTSIRLNVNDLDPENAYLVRINGGAWQYNHNNFNNRKRDSILAELTYGYTDPTTGNYRQCITKTKLFVDEHAPLDITSIQVFNQDDCLLNNAQATIQLKNNFGSTRYRRNNGAYVIGNPTFVNLGSGLHLFEALDARSCKDTMSVRITEPPKLSITTTTKANETDCTPNNATITVNTTGARGGLSYRAGTGPWFGANPISGLGTGTYKVMAQDATGCKDSVNVSISEKAMPAVTKIQDSVEICAGASTTLSIDGGGTYLWSNGMGTAATVSVTPGATTTYTVTVTHATSGCTVVATRKVVVRPNPVFNVSNASACANQTALLNVGTQETLTYSWGGDAFTTNGSIFLLAGVSTTLVAKNQWGCTSPPLVVGVGIIPIGGQILGPDEVCPGVPFSLTLRPSGGPDVTQTYTITAPQAVPMAGISNGCPFNASKTIGIKPLPSVQIQAPDSLCAGSTALATATASAGVTYAWSTGSTSSTLPMYAGETMSVTVTAPNGCKATDTHTIHSLPIPAPLISASGPLNCAGDSVTLSASGLLPGTSYQWSNGGSTANIRVAPSVPTAYILTATRSGCVGMSNILTLTPPVALSVVDTVVNPRCFGTATGRISLTLSGGTLPYAYAWSSGQTTASIQNLPVGPYAVTVTDANGCTWQKSYTLQQPPRLNLSLSVNGEMDCSAGNASIKARSGNAQGRVQYRLGAGAYDTTSVLRVLSNGLQTVWVKDSVGCEHSDTIRVNERIAPKIDTFSIVGANCSPKVQVNLQLKPSDVCWSRTFAIQGQAVQSGGSFGLDPGVYTVVMSAANIACFSGNDISAQIGGRTFTTCTDSIRIDLRPYRSMVRLQKITLTDTADCVRNNIQVKIQGDIQHPDSVDYVIEGRPFQADSVFRNLSEGTYRVGIRYKSTGCITWDTITIQEHQPLQISAQKLNDQADCILENVEVNLLAQNQRGPLTFRLPNGQVLPASFTSGSRFTKVYAVDSTGCRDSLILDVRDELPAEWWSYQLFNTDDCAPGNARLQIHFPDSLNNNGSPIVQLNWRNPQSQLSIDSLPLGNSLLRVQLADCKDSVIVNVKERKLDIVDYQVSNTGDCNENNNTLRIRVAGAKGQISYQLDSSSLQFDSVFVGVKAGRHLIRVSDSTACQDSLWITIRDNIPFEIASLGFTSACDTADGRLVFRSEGNGIAHQYSIDGGDTWQSSPIFNGLGKGFYYPRRKTLPSGCVEVMDSFLLGSGDTCIQVCNGDSIFVGQQGLNPFCLKWIPEYGLANPLASYTKAAPDSSTVYQLLITDDDGNILDTLTYRVEVCPRLAIDPPLLNLCEDKDAKLTVRGGIGPFVWKNETGLIVGTGRTFMPVLPGVYEVFQQNPGNNVGSAKATVTKTLVGIKLEIEPSLASLCGDSIRLSAPGPFHHFVWKDSLGQVIGNNYAVMIKNLGKYTLSASAGVGCTLNAQSTVVPAGFALQLSATEITLPCTTQRNLPSHSVITRRGTGVDSLTVTAPERYTFSAQWLKGCESCGPVRLSIENDAWSGGPSPCSKVLTRTWVARDDCGRRVSATQTIRFQDTIRPRFVQFPPNATLAWGLPLPTETPIATDNCDLLPRTTVVVDSTVTDSVKTVRFHWTARDTCGNSIQQTQTITYRKAAVEEEYRLVPKYNCGDNYLANPPSNQNPLLLLRPKDILDVYGFVAQVVSIDGPNTNANGFYSGEAVAIIPFANKPARFRFNNLRLNTGYQALSGEMTSVADGDFTPPSFDTARAKLDICLPPPAEPKGPNGENDGGFDEDGRYVNQPPYKGYKPGDPFDPRRDPNGFDAEGNHIETGTKYNPQGCSAQGVDSLGNKCDPQGPGPYYWLTNGSLKGPQTPAGIAFANEVRDTIRPMVVKILKKLIEETDSLIALLSADCDSIRKQVDTVFLNTGLEQRSMVFGLGGKYYSEGLSKNYKLRPKLLPETVAREGDHLQLQQRHMKLFECDEKLAKLHSLLSVLKRLEKDPELSNLVREMIERIKRLDTTEIAELKKPGGLFDWLEVEVSGYANNINEFEFRRIGSTEATPLREKIRQSRAWGANLREKTADESRLEAAKLQWESLRRAEWENGAEFVGGVHRAFLLRDIIRKRESQAFDPIDTIKGKASFFPLELNKEIGGRDQTIIFDQVRISPSGPMINTYIIISFGGKEIALRGLDIPFTPAGLSAEGKIYLANAVEIRLSNSAMLVLKPNETYVSWDCSGFKGVKVKAVIELCESIVVPLAPGTQTVDSSGTRVKAHIDAFVADFNNFVVGVTVDPFAIKGYEDFKFTITNAYADFSDTETPSVIRFPEGYTFTNNSGPRWRGIYLGNVSFTFPNFMAGNSVQSINIQAEEFIYDDQGVSGYVLVPNLVPLSQGNFSGWAGSIDTASIRFMANRFVGAGLAGYLHLPLFGKPDGEIGPEDCFRYKGMIEPKNVYRFRVIPREEMQMDLLKAQVTLTNSAVQMTLAGGQFTAEAILNGSVRLNPAAERSNPQDTSKSSGKGFKIGFSTLHFNGLKLRNRAPYLSPGNWTLPDTVGTKTDGFTTKISQLKFFTKPNDEAGLSCNMDLKLADDFPITASGAFEIYGVLKTENNRQRWVGKGLRLNRLKVKGEIKGTSIGGDIARFDESNSNGFGTGYRGIIFAKFAKIDAGVDVLGQFGNMGTYKYFMVDAMATLPKPGVPLGPMFIRKLGGGLSYRMDRSDESTFPVGWRSPSGVSPSLTALGTSLSGIQYYPDPGKGIGLRLALKLTAENEEAFNATVGLEAIFNSSDNSNGGGISKLNIDGYIEFMSEPDLASVPAKGPESGDANPQETTPSLSKVSGFIGIKYNFDERVFDANFRVFFNTPNLTGRGDAQLHFSPKKWFINIGHPTDTAKRVRLNMKVPFLPKDAATLSAYLCIGNDIPPMPPLPAYIRDLTELGLTQGAESSRASGNGFAFGADVKFDLGELKFLILYASMSAGLGFDLQLQQYNGVNCAGSGELGINGWYASGQMWAFVQAEVGLFSKKRNKKFPIASVAAAVALQGQLPNPFWAKGSLAGRYAILGGLVKGKFNFKFSIGKACEMLDETGQPIEEREIELLSELRPATGANRLHTLTRPQAIFTLPINKESNLIDEEGEPFNVKPLIRTLTLRDSLGQLVAGEYELSSDGLQATFIPAEFLAPNMRYRFVVEVSSGSGATLILDKDSVSFRTGPSTLSIPQANVAYSYPLANMQSFYRFEKADRQGYIQLKLGQKDILGFGQPVFASFQGPGLDAKFQALYNSGERRLYFQLPAEAMQPSSGYTLTIVSGDVTLLTIPFRTSRYDYFKDKVKAFEATASGNWSGMDLQFNSLGAEPFDALETQALEGSKTAMIGLEMVIDNYPWFVQHFGKMYGASGFKSMQGFAPSSRDASAQGKKGEKALLIPTPTSMQCQLHGVLLQDFNDYKLRAEQQEAERLKRCGNDRNSRDCERDDALLNYVRSTPPKPAAGSIPALATYHLPGASTPNSNVFFQLIFGANNQN